MENIRDKIDMEKFKKYMDKYPSVGEMRVNSEKIILYPEKGKIFDLFAYVRNYDIGSDLVLCFGKHREKGKCLVIKQRLRGKTLDQENYIFEKREDLEKKIKERPEIPKDIFDAVNSKIPEEHKPGLDFDHVSTGYRAKRELIKMFPEDSPKINKFTAKQAKFFYYNIRKKYG